MNRRRFLALLPVLPAAAKAIIVSAAAPRVASPLFVRDAVLDRTAYAGGEAWAREMARQWQTLRVLKKEVPAIRAAIVAATGRRGRILR